MYNIMYKCLAKCQNNNRGNSFKSKDWNTFFYSFIV